MSTEKDVGEASVDAVVMRYRRRVEFLRKLFDLFAEYDASVEIQVERRSEIESVESAELYVGGCGDLVGTGRGGLQTADVDKFLNVAIESLDEMEMESAFRAPSRPDVGKHGVPDGERIGITWYDDDGSSEVEYG